MSFMRNGKVYAYLLSSTMILSILSTQTASAAEENTQGGSYTDIAGHWGEQYIQNWSDYGVVVGHNGKFRPDDSLTRGEFAVVLQGLMGYEVTAENDFADLPQDFYTTAVLKLQAAGIFTGHKGNIRPTEAITREEAAVMLARALHLDLDTQSPEDTSFADDSDISLWAKDAVNQLEALGAVTGRQNNKFAPQSTLTRTEVLTMMQGAIDLYVQKAGSYSQDCGNLVVSSSDVDLKDMVVSGNLILAEGIEAGSVSLEGVTIEGNLFLLGGGDISLQEVEVQGSVLVQREAGSSKVLVTESSLPVVTLASDVSLELVDSQVEKVVITEGEVVSLLGDFALVENHCSDLSLEIQGELGTMENKVSGTINGVPVEAGEQLQSVPQSSSQDSTQDNSQDSSQDSTGSKPNAEDYTWSLVWEDEFTGESLNLDNWSYQTGTGAEYGLDSWGNGEAQSYQKENVFIQQEGDSSHLVIRAQPEEEAVDGKYFTSGRILTQGLQDFTYGRFESKIALPVEQGMWPAFWLLPTNSPYGGWAAGGEIDIMEAAGLTPEKIGGTIHYGGSWPNNTYSGGDYHFEDSDISQFHVYSVEWEPGEIRWYVDDVLYHTENSWYATDSNDPNNYTFPAPFDSDFHIILNLAIGGWYSNELLPENGDNWDMLVDYVRVYQLDEEYYTKMEDYVDSLFDVVPDKGAYLEGSREADSEGNFTHELNDSIPQTSGVSLSEGDHFGDSWNFHLDGTASATLTEVDGTVEVDITDDGDAYHSVQLIDYVPLAEGRSYELSFSAKADSSRSISSQMTSSSDSGWASFSGAFESLVDTQWQDYCYYFTVEKEPVADTRLEISLGQSNVNLSMKDIVLKEVESIPTDSAKAPLADGNHVHNGSFDKGAHSLVGWETTGTVSVLDSKAISLEVGATLRQGGISQIAEEEYLLTFHSTGTGTVSLVSGEEEIFSEDYKAGEQSFSFTASTEEGSLVFTANSTVTLDDVVLVKTSNNSLDVDAIHKSLLSNGDFSEEMAHWGSYCEPWSEEGGDLSLSVETLEDGNTILVADVTQINSRDWDPMISAEDMLPFSNGIEYTISFDAWAENARDILFCLDDAGYSRPFSTSVSLGEEKETYSFTYTAPGTGESELSAKLFLGNMADSGGSDSLGKLYFDNVMIYATEYFDPEEN